MCGCSKQRCRLGHFHFMELMITRKFCPFLKPQHHPLTGRCANSLRCFFRKLIQKWPDEMKEYLLKLTRSKDPIIRKFFSETLRPVKENRWFYKNPNFSLSILRHLFREHSEYTRTSVGNNLSDLARQLPDLVFELVKELVASGDRNSYWIAYRACRNLVKQEPTRAINLLHVEEYRYNRWVYRQREYPRD